MNQDFRVTSTEMTPNIDKGRIKDLSMGGGYRASNTMGIWGHLHIFLIPRAQIPIYSYSCHIWITNLA